MLLYFLFLSQHLPLKLAFVIQMLLLLTCKPLKMVLGAKSLNQITIPKLLFFNNRSISLFENRLRLTQPLIPAVALPHGDSRKRN